MREKIFYLLFLIIVGCDSFQEEKPPIERDLFIKQLATFAVLEGSYNISLAQHPNGLESLMKSYAFVLDSLDINPEEFEKTYLYYLAKPKVMSEIYEEAISIINVEKAKLEATRDKINIENANDSIQH